MQPTSEFLGENIRSQAEVGSIEHVPHIGVNVGVNQSSTMQKNGIYMASMGFRIKQIPAVMAVSTLHYTLDFQREWKIEKQVLHFAFALVIIK